MRAKAATTIPQPLAYGYLSVPDDVSDREIRYLERAIRRYALRRGFELLDFFFEFHCGSFRAWAELVEAVRRARAQHVIIPSLDHIARSPYLRLVVLQNLESATAAEVHSLREIGCCPALRASVRVAIRKRPGMAVPDPHRHAMPGPAGDGDGC